MSIPNLLIAGENITGLLCGGQIRTTSITNVCLPEKHKGKSGYVLHKGDLVAGQTLTVIVSGMSPITNT